MFTSLPVDGLAPLGTRISLCTAMTKFRSRIYRASTFEGLINMMWLAEWVQYKFITTRVSQIWSVYHSFVFAQAGTTSKHLIITNSDLYSNGPLFDLCDFLGGLSVSFPILGNQIAISTINKPCFCIIIETVVSLICICFFAGLRVYDLRRINHDC